MSDRARVARMGATGWGAFALAAAARLWDGGLTTAEIVGDALSLLVALFLTCALAFTCWAWSRQDGGRR